MHPNSAILPRVPSQYRRRLPALKAALLARVFAGDSLRALAREPGMPRPQTVRNWALADPAFAEALADARRRGDWARRFAFDEATAAAFLARARAGARINDLIGSAGMPSRRAYRHWCATQPAFAEAVFALRRRRDAGIGALGRARLRGFDRAAGDRVIVALNRGIAEGRTLEEVLAGDPGLPSRPVLARWRRENPEFGRVLRMMFAGAARRRAAAFRVPQWLSEEICEHIVEGGSFASYCRAGGPSRTTLRRWYRVDAAFAAKVDEACRWRDTWLHEQAIDIAMRTPAGPLREMNRAVGPIFRQMTRLRHRPGAVHARRGLTSPGDGNAGCSGDGDGG